MTADELRELADKLVDPSDTLFKFHMDQAAAYLRACADALDAGPVAWTQQDDEALEPDMQSAWISVQDRMPPDDTPVLVYVPGNEMLAFAIDQWQMQREAPLGWSSATIETGMGWGDHDYEDVSHWMPLTAPGHPLDPDEPPECCGRPLSCADDVRALLDRLKAAEAEAQRLRESLRGLLAVTSSTAPGTGLIVGAEDRHAAAIKQARAALENTDAR